MKRKFLPVVSLIAGMTIIFAGAALYAGTSAADVMELKADYEHKKGIVQFSHKKHAEEYKNGENRKITCGECHHDKDGKALADLKDGDNVQKCFECHNKPGEIKGKNAKDMSDRQKREYHANAMHDNCIDCHKAYNKKNKTKDAPQTCSKCHPKTK
ncbi:MAG: cytochrome c3 family protein [Desulfococcaceae bacterium]|jgi:hypothetical protein|nr:cytochrome c3 family protein [Desulfococcaceae bacterium]